MEDLRILPCGDQALTVQLSDRIDEAVNARVIALAAALDRAAIPGILEHVPTYRSLLVRYDPLTIRGHQVEQRIRALLAGLTAGQDRGRHWRVPVHYGGEAGMDLAELAAEKGMTPQALIDLHSGVRFRVFMIGFAPGFAYLGGLPKVLHTPRLKVPRQRIPAGAVGIGGQQGSISSVAGPSGWRFLGGTPVRLFDPARDPAFLLTAGDTVQFAPIGADEYADMAARAAKGQTVIAPQEAP
ncbi:5-oxoprolinase subunit PxpB [Paracoccus shanxieyensis]|uniref:5-oxoprolinase subunit PxpB n=1 Tax=Paracoccus shanxieyensis TaxID=2675752 RepID=A0A6L6J610_9RHOB|nr:5-oxoprolinase subunit PxpB [Paracoccus shanxieyensis]MTH66207.1 5-oxoprolinase subunit PxpB [Paracoccus shanxieyensis]MTH89445.1 5-oxoprolinase subunit PxpB [Paracoccus shanxieyensis]